MGALACMLKDLGYEITGSDHAVYPPMSDFLRNKGVIINEGFNEENLNYKPDLVIVGNAISSDNSEVAAILKKSLYYCSMPQALNFLASKNKKQLLITGTHGKTTTSSLLSYILFKAGLEPSFMIGGILKNFDSNYRIGSGDYIVIEGDEYDTAFFDKGAKFFHYNPSIAVLGNIEFDHADIFTDLNHVKNTFKRFADGMDVNSSLYTFDTDQNIKDVTVDTNCKIVNYGKRTESDWSLGKFYPNPPYNNFEVYKKGELFSNFETRLTGEHNLLNALSVIAIADSLNIQKDIIKSALKSFESVKRRQEIRGVKKGITVMDDFAHHPTAVRETVKALKPFYSGKIIAVFEPRTNSSMRDIFQNIYPSSFDDADLIFIREPSMIKKVSESERFSSKKLVSDLNSKGKEAYYYNETESIMEHIAKIAEKNDLVLIMSNGGFDNIHERLLDIL
ncbi:MAG: UDP-N-acetylmuramate:L-alanyl-gamma-D-glutamyl-meso-diaminopimelate ligase [Desulfobacterales bacterium]|nr:UDP-N-acetylmuramate:L-alanyl-gamma-D-glutamyl-meso-diaminopimelate ligase [Desulfobacterales bacterium]MCP4160737.1 UDP-N-acetylmuramate:L-alanyl-gamma-D-glutamyl-meso-diaminopimelate ligase [Deltaproteobacteria bacterium]